MLRLLPKLGFVITAAGVVFAMTVSALSVPVEMLGQVGSGAPAPVALGRLEQRSLVYAGDGTVLAGLFDEINRQPVALGDVAPHVVATILAVEDAGFWTHDGTDGRALLRALAVNLGSGDVAQGGSTITQQLVKLSLVGTHKTLDRKVQEFVLARRLERELTKEEILTRYLNAVYFGNRAYGIQAAAETYFGVSAGQLDMAQAALLAGLIRNPSAYNPVRHPDRALRRRASVVERMLAEGLVTPEEAAVIGAAPVPDAVHEVVPFANDYFVEEVKQLLLDDPRFGLGTTSEERSRAVFSGGLRVYTTLDRRAQQLALAARDEQLGPGGVFDIGPGAQGTAAVVSVEPVSGAVRAMVGGPGFGGYQFNLATQNPRQGGSSFKTFVLAALMEQGASPLQVVDGTGPCTFANPAGAPNPYVAENFGGSVGGPGTILDQTLHSSNCAYLRLGQMAGLQSVVDVAHSLGVTAPLDPSVLSLPLGTQEITPLEMAAAYAALANDGAYNRPYYIDRIEDAAGRVVYQHAPAPWPAISPRAARLVTWVLQQNVERGTGTAAQLGGRPAAGKTGTAQDSADAWFVGYTPQLATAVWVGGMGGRLPVHLGGAAITGGSHPARIWGSYMRPWHDPLPWVGFPAPEIPEPPPPPTGSESPGSPEGGDSPDLAGAPLADQRRMGGQVEGAVGAQDHHAAVTL